MWKQKKVVAEPKPLPRINDMGLYKAYMRLCNNGNKKQIGNKLSEWERDEIIRLRKQGLSLACISVELGRSEVTVRDVLCREGLVTGKKGHFRDDITVEMVVELREKGLTQMAIAQRLGCSQRLVEVRLNHAIGEKRRNDTHNSDSDIRSDSDRGTFGG